MIPGIVAAQVAGLSNSSVPFGALIHLDFLNGIYFDGELTAPEDVIDHPEWIGEGGLEIRAANETTEGSGVAHFIGNALELLMWMEWTIVIEYEELEADGATRILVMQDFGDFLMVERENTGEGLGITVDDFDDLGSIYRAVNDGTPRTEGIHRIAFTRTAEHLAASVDGDAVIEDATVSAGVSVVNATIGAGDGEFLFNDLNFRSITLYPPVSNADLPSLSSL